MKFFYFCPICGYCHVSLIPRKRMRCYGCRRWWTTHHGKCRRKFSITVTLLYLAILAGIGYGIYALITALL